MKARPVLQAAQRVLTMPPPPAKKQRLVGLPAAFWRGGTSKGIFFLRSALPASQEDWRDIFLGALGSPDPYGRQLDGMGGGLSSLSKICVIEASARDDSDVNYTFVQVGVKAEAVVDYSSQCGNLVSAVGPFAIEHGLPSRREGDEAVVRIFNTNTKKVVHGRFRIDTDGLLDSDGDYSIDGVPGRAARITCDYIEPGGSRTGAFLPTGNVTDRLELSGSDAVEASLIDCGNPVVFVAAAAMQTEATISPDAMLAHPTLLARLETIRQAGAVAMGLAKSLSETPLAVPKICMVAPVTADDQHKADVHVRTISSKDPHRAIPMTCALATAAAARTPGSIVNRCLRGESIDPLGVTIGHPSGTLSVSATMRERDGKIDVERGTVYRTARKLFEGTVYAKVTN